MPAGRLAYNFRRRLIVNAFVGDILRRPAGPDAVRERIAKNVPFFKELIASAKIPQIE